MRWDRGYQSGDIEDRRGEGGAGFGGGGFAPMAILGILGRFGWKGIIIGLLIVALMSSGMCTNMCTGAESPGVLQQAPTSNDQDELTHFVGFVFDDVQKTWATKIPDYQKTRLVLFRNSIGSACGTATSAVGPFYCPIDRKVYVDLAFYDELRRRFGAPGDFAQAYVIAHEVGHHVQNQRGLLGKGEVEQVAIELQADCLAGAWAKSADQRNLVEVGDVDEALNAASQIGDDTLQRKAGQAVQPEKWTHGSSAQRVSAFHKGFDGGAQACGIATR
jgi:uncharacterized protein